MKNPGRAVYNCFRHLCYGEASQVYDSLSAKGITVTERALRRALRIGEYDEVSGLTRERIFDLFSRINGQPFDVDLLSKPPSVLDVLRKYLKDKLNIVCLDDFERALCVPQENPDDLFRRGFVVYSPYERIEQPFKTVLPSSLTKLVIRRDFGDQMRRNHALEAGEVLYGGAL